MELRFEDGARHLRTSKKGYALRRGALDAWGNATRESFFSEEGKPTVSAERYASATTTYDDRGNATQVCYADEAGKPTPGSEPGAECVRRRYDAMGRLVWAGA